MNTFTFTPATTKVTIMISIPWEKTLRKGPKTTLPVGLRKLSKATSTRFLSSQGFTLVEVLIVLTIIVLLSTAAAPSFKGFSTSSRLKSDVHAVRDLLGFARDTAITEHVPYFVVFDLDANQYWLADSETFDVDGEIGILSTNETIATNTIEEQAYTVSRTSMILMRPREVTQGTTIAEISVEHGTQSIQKNTGTDYIYFSPNGSAEDAILIFENSTENLMRISVNSDTANIKIDEIQNDEYEG